MPRTHRAHAAGEARPHPAPGVGAPHDRRPGRAQRMRQRVVVRAHHGDDRRHRRQQRPRGGDAEALAGAPRTLPPRRPAVDSPRSPRSARRPRAAARAACRRRSARRGRRRAARRPAPVIARRRSRPARRAPAGRGDGHSGSSRNLPSRIGHQHARALVHAVVVGRRHVEHALAADHLLLLLERVAQRDAERLGAGLAGLRGDRNRALQQQAAVPGVGAERRRLDAELLLVGRDVRLRDLLGRVAVGDLVDDQHRAGGEDRALDLVLAELDEVVGRDGVRLVDRALVALVAQRGLRQHRGAADGGDQHRVGLRREDLQRLAGDALVRARVALVGDDADARPSRRAARTPCASSRRTDR